MGVEYKRVLRTERANEGTLDSFLLPRQFGFSNDTQSLYVKDTNGNMVQYFSEGSDANYNALRLNGLARSGFLYADANGNISVQDVPSGSTSDIFSTWTYSSTTTPSAIVDGTWRANNADTSIATEIYITQKDLNGEDYESIMSNIGTGSTITFQDTDSSSNYYLFRTTGNAMDDGTYFTIPVEVLGYGLSQIPNGTECTADITLESPVSTELYDGNGVISGMGISIGAPTSTFSVASGTYNRIGVGTVSYAGVSNQSVTNIGTTNQTYIALNTSTGVITQQSTHFTPAQRRTHVVLGVLIHTDNATINAVNTLPDVAHYTLSQYNDLLEELGPFNNGGNIISANGANLSINKSSGEIWKRGVNFENNPDDPHTKDMASFNSVTTPTLRMRMSNGVEGSNTGVLDLKYESSTGVLSTISSGKYGVFRVVLFPSNLIRIQYPQFVYNNMAEAQNAIPNEQYITETNMADNGLLRSYVIIRGGATALNNSSDARFIQADRFGQMPFGGSGGGTTTLQGAYDNSAEPEITTNSTNGAVTIKRGSASDTNNVLEIKNGSDAVTAYITGEGYISTDNIIRVRDAGENAEGTFIDNDSIRIKNYADQAMVEMFQTGGTNGEIRLWSQSNQCYIKAETNALNISTGGQNGVKIDSPHTLDTIAEIDADANAKVLVSREYVEGVTYPYADVKDPTGFTEPENIVVTYSVADRKITLTGTVKAYWRGEVVTALVNNWTCPDAHNATVGNWFLYYNGDPNVGTVGFIWSQTPWTFDKLQIAEVYYGANDWFAVREVHGLMDHRVHGNLHKNIGTYKKSGGAFTAGSYQLGNPTGDKAPQLEASLITDEDIDTVIASVHNSYTQFYLSGAGVPTFLIAQSAIVDSTQQFKYNLWNGSTWSTPVAPNTGGGNYGKIFVVNIPVTADALSQNYRTLWVMPQQISTNLATIQALTPSSISWGTISSGAVQEFVFVGEIIVHTTNNNWELTSVSTLSGNRSVQVSTPASNVTAQGTTNTIQVTNGFGVFTASNAQIYDEASNCHLYLGSTTTRNGVIEADGGVAIIVDNDEISTVDGFYVKSRDADAGVTIFKVIQSENATTGGVPEAPQSSNTKIDNVGNKALITREYLTNSTSSLVSKSSAIFSKTITIEAPTNADSITVFRTDVAITVTEVNAVLVGSSTPSVTYYVRHGTNRSSSTANVASDSVTNTTTGAVASLTDTTLDANDWIWLDVTAVSGTVGQISVDIRYTID